IFHGFFAIWVRGVDRFIWASSTLNAPRRSIRGSRVMLWFSNLCRGSNSGSLIKLSLAAATTIITTMVGGFSADSPELGRAHPPTETLRRGAVDFSNFAFRDGEVWRFITR